MEITNAFGAMLDLGKVGFLISTPFLPPNTPVSHSFLFFLFFRRCCRVARKPPPTLTRSTCPFGSFFALVVTPAMLVDFFPGALFFLLKFFFFFSFFLPFFFFSLGNLPQANYPRCLPIQHLSVLYRRPLGEGWLPVQQVRPDVLRAYLPGWQPVQRSGQRVACQSVRGPAWSHFSQRLLQQKCRIFHERGPRWGHVFQTIR